MPALITPANPPILFFWENRLVTSQKGFCPAAPALAGVPVPVPLAATPGAAICRSFLILRRHGQAQMVQVVLVGCDQVIAHEAPQGARDEYAHEKVEDHPRVIEHCASRLLGGPPGANAQRQPTRFILAGATSHNKHTSQSTAHDSV